MRGRKGGSGRRGGTGRTSFVCPTCGKRYKTVTSLKRHMKAKGH